MEDNPKNSLISVIKNPGFGNLWLNQIFVQLSYNALNFSLIIWVFQLTNSNFKVSLLMFSVYLPAVLLGLIAGVFVDLYNRKKVIMMVNILMSICFFSLIFLKGYYPAILMIAFLVNTLAQFYTPAESSSIPLLVRRSQLLSANSLFSITLFSTFLLGFGLAGPLIEFFGINSVFLLGAAILFLGFVLSFFFPNIRSSLTEESLKLKRVLSRQEFSEIKSLMIKEIRFALELVRRNLPLMVAISIMSGVQATIAVLAVLIPGFLEDVLHINATNASYIMVIPLGIGMVLGGVVLSKFGNRFSKRRIVGTSILVAGVMFLLVGLAPIISPATKYLYLPKTLPFFYQIPLSSILAAGSFLLGVCLVGINVPSQTVIQEYTPENARGKVFAVLGTFMAAVSLLPVLLTGVISQLFGPMVIFFLIGGIVTFFGIVALWPALLIRSTHISDRLKEFLGHGHWN